MILILECKFSTERVTVKYANSLVDFMESPLAGFNSATYSVEGERRSAEHKASSNLLCQ